jgi:soluble lytic murein transglycosylase
MQKSFFISVIFIFCLLANVANSNDFGLSSNNIGHLKKAIKYVNSGDFTQAKLEAAKTQDKDIIDLILWMNYNDGVAENGYEEISAFIEKHPTWPRQTILQNRAEAALNDDIPTRKILQYFKNSEPVTGRAMRILAEAKINNGESNTEINKLLRKAWIQGDFSNDEEKQFLKEHSKRLRQQDHIARIDRLLWEQKADAAKRLIGRVNDEYKTLFTARIYLIEEKKGSDTFIARINEKLKNDSGLLYERINWQLNRKNYNSAYKYLTLAKGTLPYQEKWWEAKNIIIRELIDINEYKRAYKLVSTHGNEKGTSDYADAEWLSGWIALNYLNQKNKAYEHFYAMYENVNFPISKSRAAYWAGRAAEDSSQKDIADKWYKLAAKHPTTFYGQMAFESIYPNTKINLPAIAKDSNKGELLYKKNKLAKAAYLLIKTNQTQLAEWFLKAAIDESKNEHEMYLISKLGLEAGKVQFSVIAAKHALKNNVVLTTSGWPIIKKTSELFAEKPIVMAIVRQESLFDKNAESVANAKGLMQIIPSTAKLVSNNLKIKYNEDMLKSNPDYNMKLGSYYINKLINQFDGSYVLAIASYNAGPGNVRKWMKKYGDPRNASSHEEVIDWIEHIPFEETRNYVQRVMENTQVYRHILDDQVLTLEKDLMRYDTKLSSN